MSPASLPCGDRPDGDAPPETIARGSCPAASRGRLHLRVCPGASTPGRPISGVARNNHSGLAAGVRWGMVTSAEVKITAAGQALLTKEGRRLTLRVLEPAGAELKIYPTDPPPAATDAGNRGTRMLGFEVKVPAGASSRIAVLLVPGTTREAPAGLRPLDEW